MCVSAAFPCATECLGQFCFSFSASIIGTFGPSFLVSGHLNIPKVSEGCWNLICVGSNKEIGVPNRPNDADDAGLLGT